MKSWPSLTAILALGSAALLHAGNVHVWGIREVEDAPLLAVATVEAVTKKPPPPPDRTRPNASAQYWEAALRVHRSHLHQPLRVGERINVSYVTYGDPDAGGGNGRLWPQLKTGQTALFPLTPVQNGSWRLVADEGRNLTVPALIKPPRADKAPLDGRAFILAELANTLANDDTPSRFTAAVYLSEAGAWPDGLREIVEIDVGANDDRWLELACALLASLSIPHPTIAQLMSRSDLPGFQMPAWALVKGARRDYPQRLIGCLIRNMAAYEWGAANELLEFKDSPLVISSMKNSLSRDPAGSISVAWALVRNGQRGFLPDALGSAVSLVSAPERVSISRLQASALLLRDYGRDQQFDVIPATLRRLKEHNEGAYRKLFGSVNYMQNRRELRVAAVLIDDRRSGFGTLRYCDVAAATVERLSGQTFGIKQQMSPEERDRAVALAADWLASQTQAGRKRAGKP